MPSPLHITFRLAGEYSSTEPPKMGEPRWDTVNKRLGMFDSGTAISWYPQIDPVENLLFLNPNQKLSGKTAINQPNNIHLDMTVPNELRILNVASGQTIARFTSGGAFFNSTIVSGTTEITFQNMLANSSLTKKLPLTVAKSTDNNGTFVVAPNWLVWKNSQVTSIGNLIAEWSAPIVSGADSSLKITAEDSPNAAGVRHIIFTKNLAGESLTVSCYYKANTGEKAIMRVTSPAGSVASKVITANGNTQREELSFTVPANQDILYFDSLYTPSFENATLQPWEVCAPMVNKGLTAFPFERKNQQLEEYLTSAFYVKNGYTSAGTVNLFFGRELTGNAFSLFASESNSIVSINSTSARLTITSPDGANKTYEVISYVSTAETS